MNSICVFLAAFALFGAFAHAFLPQCRTGLGYELGFGAGYGGCFGGSFGGRAPAVCGPTICDTCHCVKTIVRPTHVERIPYACSRRVQVPACGAYPPATSVDVFAGAAGTNGYLNGGFGTHVGGGYAAL